MHFANPWGLLALLAIPVILTIHLYRRRYPPLQVAGLHLWASETRTNPPGRRRDRLPFSKSLILELLAALFIALVLADPKFGRVENAAHLIVVLDSSASMQARPAESGSISFRDAAIATLENRMKSLPSGSRFTVILTGLRPTTLAGPAVVWADVRTALADWQPGHPRHSFEPAWDAALQLREQSGGELLFITDRLLPESSLPPLLELAAVGKPLDNVGISSVNWSRPAAAGSSQVFVQLQNHGDEASVSTVVGRHGEREIFKQQVSLIPGGIGSFQAPIPTGTGRLTVRVDSPADGLAVDNVAELIEPRIRKVRVAIEITNARSRQLLERGFQALPQVELVSRNDPQADPDLVIASVAALPTGNTRAWWLGIGPISTSEAERKKARNLIGPYLMDRRNSLLEGMTLGGVVWGGVQPLSLDVLPLVSAGQIPLLAQLNRRRNFVGILNIDFEKSNLGETPDWPILLHNLVELRRADLPGLQRWNYHLGEDVQFRLFEEDREIAATRRSPLELSGPDYQVPITRGELLELPELPRPGVYEIRDGDQEIGRFAVNFRDPEESNLRQLGTGTRRPAQVTEQRELRIDSPYTWALLVGLGLILATVLSDWYILGRTSPVRPAESSLRT